MPGKRLHVDYLPKKKKAFPGCEQPLSNFRPPPPYTVYDKALALTPGTVLPSRGIFAAPVPARTFRTTSATVADPDDVDYSHQFALPRYGKPSSMNSYLRTKAPVPNPVRPYDELNASFQRTASLYPPSSTGSYPPEFPKAGKGHYEGKRPPGTWSNTVWKRPVTAPTVSEGGAGDAGDKTVTFTEGEARPSTAAYTYTTPVGYYPGNNTASRAKVPNAIKPRQPVYGEALHHTRSRYPTAPTNYPPMFPKAGFILSESYKVPKLPAWER